MTNWQFGSGTQTDDSDTNGYTAIVCRPILGTNPEAHVIEGKIDGARIWDAWITTSESGTRMYIGSTRSDGYFWFAIDTTGTRVTPLDLHRSADDALSALIDAAATRGLVSLAR